MYSDFHNDFLTDENSNQILDKYNATENNIVCAIFRGTRNFDCVYNKAKRFMLNKNPNLHLAFEDIGFESLWQIEQLAKFRPTYCTLTWNGENNLGFGANGGGGLKQMGREVIKILNKHKIAVDTAHTNAQSFYEILETADKVVNSHCAFSAINPHLRNISDEQVKHLLQKGGLIGLCLYSPFLTANAVATAENVFEHIDYFVQKFDYNRLCIGSDYYGAQDFPLGLESYEKWSNLEKIMRKNGYNDSIINAILNANLKNYLG